MEQKNEKQKTEEKKIQQPKKKINKSSKNDEFKRRYFEFYDDIKISDRQDW